MRKKAGGPKCGTLIPHEHVGHVDYEFMLGNVQKVEMQRSGGPPQNDSAGHLLVSPARPRIHARPGLRRLWRDSSLSKATSTTRSCWR
jgi:hypothetical protein